MTLTNFPNGIKTSEVVTGGSGGAMVITPAETGATSSDALSVASGTAVNGQSGGVFLFSGDTSGTGQTGNVWLYSGNTAAGTANSGDVNFLTGDSFGGDSGNISLTTGTAGSTRGKIILDAPAVTSPVGQLLYFTSPAPSDTSAGGDIGIESADTQANGGDSGGIFIGTSDAGRKAGDLSFYAGASHGTDLAGGRISISAGDAHTGNANGGDISIGMGNGIGTGRNGVFQIINLPTADPHVVGALWIDVAAARVIKSSNG